MPAFTLSFLKSLRKLLPQLRRNPAEFQEMMRAKREKIEPELPANFGWAWLYELPHNELNILGLRTVGLYETFYQAIEQGKNPYEILLEKVSDETDEPEWKGGHLGLFCKSDLLCIEYAFLCQIRAVSHHGHYMNDLIRRGSLGDKEAFFHAISIDHTAITCPGMAAQLAKAELFHDKKFIQRYISALKKPPHARLEMHQDLRFMLKALHENKLLPKLNLSEVDRLFVQELKLYTEKGEDPARSLQRFIQRWVAEQKKINDTN